MLCVFMWEWARKRYFQVNLCAFSKKPAIFTISIYFYLKKTLWYFLIDVDDAITLNEKRVANGTHLKMRCYHNGHKFGNFFNGNK